MSLRQTFFNFECNTHPPVCFALGADDCAVITQGMFGPFNLS